MLLVAEGDHDGFLLPDCDAGTKGVTHRDGATLGVELALCELQTAELSEELCVLEADLVVGISVPLVWLREGVELAVGEAVLVCVDV